MKHAKESHDVAPKTSSGTGCLVRIVWLLLGNLFLVLLLVHIGGRPTKALSGADALYGGLVAVIILLRYLDIAKLHGMTATGDKPATMIDWRRHALLLIIIAGIFWGLAHGWAYLMHR